MGNTRHVIPVVNFNKCEGHGICTHVCAANAFKMDRLTSAQFAQLSMRGKLNSLLSNNLKAMVTNPEQCNNCGLCVTACIEGAISMQNINS